MESAPIAGNSTLVGKLPPIMLQRSGSEKFNIFRLEQCGFSVPMVADHIRASATIINDESLLNHFIHSVFNSDEEMLSPESS